MIVCVGALDRFFHWEGGPSLCLAYKMEEYDFFSTQLWNSRLLFGGSLTSDRWTQHHLMKANTLCRYVLGYYSTIYSILSEQLCSVAMFSPQFVSMYYKRTHLISGACFELVLTISRSVWCRLQQWAHTLLSYSIRVSCLPRTSSLKCVLVSWDFRHWLLDQWSSTS